MSSAEDAPDTPAPSLADLPAHVLQLILARTGVGAGAAACTCSALRAAFDAVLASPPMASCFLVSRYCLATAIFYLHALKQLRPRLLPRAGRATAAAAGASQPHIGCGGGGDGAAAGADEAGGRGGGGANSVAAAAEADEGAALARVEGELLKLGASASSQTLDGFLQGMFDVAVAKDSPYCGIYADVCTEIEPLVPDLPPAYTKRPVPAKLATLLTALCRTELAAGAAAIRAARERERVWAKEAEEAAAAAEPPPPPLPPPPPADGGADFAETAAAVAAAAREVQAAADGAARRRALGGVLFAGQLFLRGLLLGPAPLHAFLREITGGRLRAEETACLCQLLELAGEKLEETPYGGDKGFTAMYDIYDKMWYACDYHDFATQQLVQKMLSDAMCRKLGRILAGLGELSNENYNHLRHQVLSVRIASTQMAEHLAEALVGKALEASGEPELYARLCGDLCKAMTHFVSTSEPGKHAKPRHAFLDRLQTLCTRQLRERDGLFAAVVVALPVAEAGAGTGAEAEAEGGGRDKAVCEEPAASAALPAAAAAAEGDPCSLRRTRRLAALAWELREAGLLVATESTLRASLQALLLDDAGCGGGGGSGGGGGGGGHRGRPGAAAVGMACKLLATLGEEAAKAPAAGCVPPPPGAVDAASLYSCRLQRLLSRPSLEPESRTAIQEVLDLRANGWVARSTATGLTTAAPVATTKAAPH